MDAGFQTFNKVTDIFITHSHADHIASLPLIILENISNKVNTKIYCPKHSKPLLENMINSFLICNYNNYSVPKKYYQVIGLDSKYILDLKLNSHDIKLKLFDCDHTVPTIAYGFILSKKKLKEEYIGLDTKDIVLLKRDGVEITQKVESRELVFCGDTSINIFTNNPEILTFKNIIIECTFFDEEDLDNAISRRHMHWLQLKPIIEENKNISFYLIHFSAKHHRNDNIDKYLEGIENVFIL